MADSTMVNVHVSVIWLLMVLTIHTLSACYQFVQPVPLTGVTKAVPSFITFVIMHENDPQLFVIKVRHRVPVASFWLSLYGLPVLNRDVNTMQSINQQLRKESIADKHYMYTDGQSRTQHVIHDCTRN